MLGQLQAFIIRVSRTWWLYLLVLATTFGSLQALLAIGERFPAYAGGHPPFDLQNDLVPGDVYVQLAAYTLEARRAYYHFTEIDYLFPLAAGIFTAATVAFLLRYSRPRWYAALTARNLLPVFLVATGFDWLENVAAVTAIDLYPREFGWLPLLLVAAKRCKLALAMAGNVTMAGLLAYSAGLWLVRTVRRR